MELATALIGHVGAAHFLVHVDGQSPHEWTVDQWLRLPPRRWRPSSSNAHGAPSRLPPLSASERSK